MPARRKGRKSPSKRRAAAPRRKPGRKARRTLPRTKRASPKAKRSARKAKTGPRTAVRRKLSPPKKTDKPLNVRKVRHVPLEPELAFLEPRPMVAAHKLILVFMGPPGVGKGTQAAKLAAELKLPHISTGDLFRDHLQRGTPLGQRAKEFMNAGKLVPDDIVVDLVADRIAAPDCDAGFVLDGFPRTVPQADKLAAALKARGQAVSAALYFDAPREVIIERISGRRTCRQCGAISHVAHSPTRRPGLCDNCGRETYQRADDAADKVRERLSVYDASTGPLVPYYRERGLLREFDARGGVDEIYAGLRRTVEALR